MHFFLSPAYIIKQREVDYLRTETGSGRSLFIFIFVLMLFFQEPYILYSGLLLCLTIWTYKTEWIFDRKTEKIRYEKRILWIVYEDCAIDISNIKQIALHKVVNGSGIGYCYKLKLVTQDQEEINIATRGQCYLLKTIVHDFRSFLPDIIAFLPHEDCLKKEPLISFD